MRRPGARMEGASGASGLLAASPIRTAWAGFNGEHLWAKEWGVSQIRHAKHLAERLQMHHPAEFFGDAGVALPAIMASLAALDLHQGKDPGPALVFASSDGPERGAALLTNSSSW